MNENTQVANGKEQQERKKIQKGALSSYLIAKQTNTSTPIRMSTTTYIVYSTVHKEMGPRLERKPREKNTTKLALIRPHLEEEGDDELTKRVSVNTKKKKE
jgi:hypothetical protein